MKIFNNHPGSIPRGSKAATCSQYAPSLPHPSGNQNSKHSVGVTSVSKIADKNTEAKPLFKGQKEYHNQEQHTVETAIHIEVTW